MQCFSWARLGFDLGSIAFFPMFLFAWAWLRCDAHCVVVSVLCACVENGALDGPMSLCQCWNGCCSFRPGFLLHLCVGPCQANGNELKEKACCSQLSF